MSWRFYDMPYVRFQPYLIGMFFGFLFYKTKRTEVKIPLVSINLESTYQENKTIITSILQISKTND